MHTLAELAREYPQMSFTIQASDLMAFGEKLIADTMAATRAAEAARIKAAESGEMLTDQEACELLGVTSNTLWRWRKRGYLSGVQVGGRIKYRKSDCLRILEKPDK